jgi:molecular chaperone DnaK (HSP70)
MVLIHKPGITPTVRVHIEVFYASIRDKVKFGAEENTRLLQAAADESRGLTPQDTAFALSRLAGRLVEHGQVEQAEPLMREVITGCPSVATASSTALAQWDVQRLLCPS